jgi:hypothetical protein
LPESPGHWSLVMVWLNQVVPDWILAPPDNNSLR